MGKFLEIIPLLHERVFPDDTPSAIELGDIARRSYQFLARLAGHQDGVTIPLANYFFNVTGLTYQNRVGLIQNWKIIDDTSLCRFEIEEDGDGRRRVIPRNWDRAYREAVEYSRLRGSLDEDSQCPALRVKTTNGSAIQTLWEGMIDIAQRWQYIVTIDKLRESRTL